MKPSPDPDPDESPSPWKRDVLAVTVERIVRCVRGPRFTGEGTDLLSRPALN